jgi:hypothetical protein
VADLDRLYATVKEQKSHIYILFANAGVSELAPPVVVYDSLCRMGNFDHIFRMQSCNNWKELNGK